MEYATVHVEAPRLPFEGQSSYSADYVPKQVPLPAVMEVLHRKVSAAFRSASSRSVARFHDTTVQWEDTPLKVHVYVFISLQVKVMRSHIVCAGLQTPDHTHRASSRATLSSVQSV